MDRLGLIFYYVFVIGSLSLVLGEISSIKVIEISKVTQPIKIELGPSKLIFQHVSNYSSNTATDVVIAVSAPENAVLLGYIQKLHLRVKDNSTECLDYIEFLGEKICHANEKEYNFNDGENRVGLLWNRGKDYRFKIERGLQFRVRFHARRKRIKTLAEILFVAYSECPESESTTLLFRCSEEKFSCLDPSFACNGEVECIFPGAFGVDERNCPAETSFVKEERRKDFTNNQRRVNDPRIQEFVIPTASFLFLIWGGITIVKKLYKCYKTEMQKDDSYHF